MQNQPDSKTADPEDIDAIIDSVVANPETAAKAKSALYATLKRRRKIVSFPKSQLAANDDDMWDNVPV